MGGILFNVELGMRCRRAIYIILFWSYLTNQIVAQSNLEFFFFNSCSQQLEQHEFAMFSSGNLEPISSKSFSVSLSIDTSLSYFLEVQIPRSTYQNFRHVFDLSSLSEDIISDTLEVPFLDAINVGSIHNQKWVYIDCSGLVDGRKEYYDEYGIIRESGIFREGKPEEISKYSKKGVLLKRSFYAGDIIATKVEFYDHNGQLDTYEIYRNKRRKNLTLTFNAFGKRISRDVYKF